MWVEYKVSARKGNDAGKVDRGQFMKSLVCQVKKLRLYLWSNREPLKTFWQGVKGDRTRVIF